LSGRSVNANEWTDMTALKVNSRTMSICHTRRDPEKGRGEVADARGSATAASAVLRTMR
jgi:hypothetical protein